MKKLFTALIALSLAACGKKVESVPGPVNPQITDAVTQVSAPVEVLDAGVVTPAVQSVPEVKPVEVQSLPESK